MQKREQELLRLLHTRKDWCTAAQLAASLSCSVRTVKSCVAGLNQRWPGLILSSHKGFLIDETSALLQQVRQEERNNSIPQDATSRRSYFFRKLLLEEQFCETDSLTRELCIAPATLANELCKLRPTLLEFGLSLHSRAGRLSIQGPDEEQRRLILWLIYQEVKEYLGNFSLLNDYFPDVDLTGIEELVKATLARHDFFLSNDCLCLVVLNIAISLQRTLRHFSAQKADDSPVMAIPPMVQQAVEELCTALEQRFSASLPSENRYDLGILFLTCGVQQGKLPQSKDVSPAIRSLTRQLCARTKAVFGMDLAAHDFFLFLALHIQNLLIRTRSGFALRTPYLSHVKVRHPYIYDIAAFLASEIDKRCNQHLTEDEISGIALNIGRAVEQLDDESSKIQALMLHSGLYYNSLDLMQRIARTFPDTLALQGLITTSDALADHPECALLISTMPVSAPVPTVQIGKFWDSHDVAVLAARIDEVRREQRRAALRTRLPELFFPELFWYDPDFATPEQAIDALCARMEQAGCVAKGFARQVLDRERISSTAQDGLALPHAFETQALHSAVAVASCSRALRWGDQRVHLVVLAAFQPDDRPLCRDFLTALRRLSANPHVMKALRAAKNRDDFVKALLDVL